MRTFRIVPRQVVRYAGPIRMLPSVLRRDVRYIEPVRTVRSVRRRCAIRRTDSDFP